MDPDIAPSAETGPPPDLAALQAQQAALERKLHESAELAARMMDSSEDCIKILNLDGALDFMSAAGQRTMEVADFDAIKGCP